MQRVILTRINFRGTDSAAIRNSRGPLRVTIKHTGLTGMLWIIMTIVVGVAKWLIYTSLLWLMIKIQKMQFNWLGLLGSSAAATALGYIPVVGPYVGWAVLVLCLWKVTHADIAPDVLFTVSIAGALMFCVNLFVLGALMGDLSIGRFASESHEFDESDTELASDSDAMDDELDDAEPAPAPKQRIASAPTALLSRTNTPPARPIAAAVPVAVSKPAPSSTGNVRNASSLPAKLSLKGLSVTTAQRTAMIASGKEIHTLAVGDLFSVASPKGTLLLRCEEITAREVILALNDGERVRLTFQ
jgi:hypothetical protein